MSNIVYPAQNATQSTGRLRVSVTTEVGLTPIENADVSISYTGQPGKAIEVIKTDNSGQTAAVDLAAPPVDYSLDVTNIQQPYSEYNINVNVPGYEPVVVSGIQLLPTVTALQEIKLKPRPEAITIAPHTLYYEYPPKIPEDEVKTREESGEIVLSEVVVPEFVVVHDGPPTDPGAKNYYVRYKDYIKNVASSEIYATWPESTITANVLAILSFTLNRVYTEWYRAKKFNFTITSSTAYDHKWIYGRNIYDNISRVVDSVFINYLSRPNIKQPILTQYCDGRMVQCPKWMTQWGSKALGDQGYNAIDIIRNFYGSDMFINTAPKVAGIPSSWPGTNLQVGSRNPNVRIIQNQLNAIANKYPAIPKVRADGVFGPGTKEAVQKFQSVFNLPVSGIVDYPTWYKISDIYVGVTRLAELV